MKNIKSIGIIRNLTYDFEIKRKRIHNDTQLFPNSESEEGNEFMKIRGLILGESGSSIEMSSVKFGNFYKDLFSTTNKLYQELKQNMTILQSEQQKRIVPKFDESENREIDEKIKHLVISMTNNAKICEKNIKLIEKNIKEAEFNGNMNGTDLIILNNMKINLAEKIQDFTLEFRRNEEKYMKNYQELVGTNQLIFDGNFDTNDSNNQQGKTNFLQTEIEGDDVLQKRDKDISTMLKSISDLASIFKDMQNLVQHQGTILDRIDYNIDATLTNTQEAHKHLKKAKEHMKGNCFRNSMLCIITVNFIFAMLLIFKFL